MQSNEFMRFIQQALPAGEGLKSMQDKLPLGYDGGNRLVFAFPVARQNAVKHVCVTGLRKTAFIQRLLFTLSRLYRREEAHFLILSPKAQYGEFLRLHAMDVTVPYVRSKADLDNAVRTLNELVYFPDRETRCKKLFVVLDGIEELDGCNTNLDLEACRNILDILARKKQVEVITGVDLIKSIFSGYPGAYVLVGNCLVTTREEGKADVTYVDEDSTLTTPVPISYPDSPSLTETVIAWNAQREER